MAKQEYFILTKKDLKYFLGSGDTISSSILKIIVILCSFSIGYITNTPINIKNVIIILLILTLIPVYIFMKWFKDKKGR
jgi:hypothetical protein